MQLDSKIVCISSSFPGNERKVTPQVVAVYQGMLCSDRANAGLDSCHLQ